jgi:hypothetical protein
MKRVYKRPGFLLLFFLFSVPVLHAQLAFSGVPPAFAAERAASVSGIVPDLPSTVSSPRMSPELALEIYEQRQQRQKSSLAAYSDDTLMVADLPSTRQKGEYELKRSYSAPGTVKFTPVKFVGDSFVKTNVLIRLLQSEVEHASKNDGSLTAISGANYKFSHKTSEVMDGRLVHVYQVRPHKKRVGLFKGKVYIDASNGALLRAEGTMVKSPSVFIRKVEFVQDYADIGGFMLPTRLHSVSKVRILGKTIVDVFHRDYKPQNRNEVPKTATATSFAGAASSSGAN